MKQTVKNGRHAKSIIFAALLAVSVNGMAQQAAVKADLRLGTISLADATGFALPADQVPAGKVISMKIPVINSNHGVALPAGSCKIKIGLGSKLVLDPQANISNNALSNYFRWTAASIGGQVQVTGELVTPLPAGVTEVPVTFSVQAGDEGTSTITANFLITNHNTTAVLSDDDGSNNAASLQYRVSNKVAPASSGKLELGIYPNPVKDLKAVMIKAEHGEFNGRYNITLTDITGKLIKVDQVQLNGVTAYRYSFGVLAAGKYLIKITRDDAAETFVLKMEKL